MRIRKRKKQTPSDSQVNIQPQLLQSRPFETQPQTEQAADLQTLQKKAQQSGFNFTDISIFAPNQTSKSIPIQPKLTLGQPNDKYEQEADLVAAQVVQNINSPQANQPVQRTEREEDEQLQMKPWLHLQARAETADRNSVPDHIEQDINQAKRGGQNLTPNLQQKMGNAMGADFSSVKVHTDSNANRLNQSIQAKAFTNGNNIFFKQGEYNPSSKPGQQLIAHELTHVVQQSGIPKSPIQRAPGSTNSTSATDQRNAINPRDEDGNRLPITHPESAIGGRIGEPRADENIRNPQVEHLIKYAEAAKEKFKILIHSIILDTIFSCRKEEFSRDNTHQEYCWNLDTDFKYITKKLSSAIEKAEKLQSYTPREGVEFMVDVLRATIVCQNDDIVEKVKETVEKKARKILASDVPKPLKENLHSFRRDAFTKDDLLEWQSPGIMKGYGDAKYFLPVVFTMPDNNETAVQSRNNAVIRCELQIHNKELTDIKEEGGGHKFYEIWRATKVRDNYKIAARDEETRHRLAEAARVILTERFDALRKGVGEPYLSSLRRKLILLGNQSVIYLNEQEYIGLELASDLLYTEIRLEKQVPHEPASRDFLEQTRNDPDDLGGVNLNSDDLREVDLSGKDLSGEDLRGKDLRGADLRGANLIYADLSGANLSDACLNGTDLIYANLTGVNLRDFDLRNVNLRGANLSGAVLIDTDLKGVNLSRSVMNAAELHLADLRGANLSSADLCGVSFVFADLRRADLSHTDLSYADLNDADLREVNLNSAIVENADFSNVSLISESLKRDLISRGARF